ncbi:MAG: hypothetical protein HQL64_00930 [Magnetococcales bacterium]|nr:hypothetical protein [Magnetococcales bacterium]
MAVSLTMTIWSGNFCLRMERTPNQWSWARIASWRQILPDRGGVITCFLLIMLLYLNVLLFWYEYFSSSQKKRRIPNLMTDLKEGLAESAIQGFPAEDGW